ncbi:MAG: ATP-binding cassette domain-containing protein, partial [Clostridia bacterium]|nr:ATP-binding cassette domain-containing protein [Clostridia bacterium]
GLDRYTSGDLRIDGKSTADFTESDWDAYRSGEVGFVFQSYNLISHQSVIENVETALSINGVKREERRERAIEALSKVGLIEHLRKTPKQLSGGEMQRVAIARAIVNDPKIVLADEPTGALDSENSVQIMDLLKEISTDRLVVTVTHNAELAEKYATRIIRIKDGRIISDSNPFGAVQEEGRGEKASAKKSVMPYSLTMKLSFRNLAGKKIRTILTSVASAIGIMGIALVLACSNGLNAFIDKVQKDTMSGTPVTVSASARDYSAYITSIFGYVDGSKNNGGDSEKQTIAPPTNSVIINRVLKNVSSEKVYNYITEDYLAYLDGLDGSRVTVDKGYDVKKFIYKKYYLSAGVKLTVNLMASTADNWLQIPENASLVREQYDIIGKFPEQANELALVVDKNSSISDTVLTSYFIDVFPAESKEYYTFDEIISENGKVGKFELLSPDDYFAENAEEGYYTARTIPITDYILKYGWGLDPEGTDLVTSTKRSSIENALKKISEESLNIKCYDEKAEDAGGERLKIVGIFRLKEDTQYGMFSTSPICYTKALTEKVIAQADASAVVRAQRASADKNVVAEKDEDGNYSQSDINGELELRLAVSSLGYADIPSKIKFYPNTISDKDYLLAYLDAYNAGKEEDKKIKYIDNVGVAIELVRSVIGGVSAVLLALTSVSLVVSAIMMGIITYVSVMERTKEIGILRSVGARKKDVVDLFITETGMIGLIAGAIGVVFGFIAAIPVNSLMKGITGINGFAFLSWWNVLAIIAASVLLTVVSGLIPSFMAGRKDPVKALRSE